MRAATEDLKLSEVSEFTTSCNFCSCGCGMIAAVRDGKLLKMEGDYDHIVNRGSLCVKGISMFATHSLAAAADQAALPGAGQRSLGGDLLGRRDRPRREESSGRHATRRGCATENVDAPDLSVDRGSSERLESAPRFIPHEGKRAVPVNRTDAIGFMGGAQNTNEECYLFQKAARLLGMPYVEHQARL
jgi:formate dehydrogenase major subunit